MSHRNHTGWCGYDMQRKWTTAEVQYLKENYGYLSIEEMSKELNRTTASVSHKIRNTRIKKVHAEREYAVYFGDDFQFIGTSREVCKRLDISGNTLMFYLSPAHKKRVSRNGIHIVDLGIWKQEGFV